MHVLVQLSYIEDYEGEHSELLLGDWEAAAQEELWTLAEKCTHNRRDKRPSSSDVSQPPQMSPQPFTLQITGFHGANKPQQIVIGHGCPTINNSFSPVAKINHFYILYPIKIVTSNRLHECK